LLKELQEPVDFELPDWFKSKPMQYTYIKRSILCTSSEMLTVIVYLSCRAVWFISKFACMDPARI